MLSHMSHTSRLGTLFASPGQSQDVDEHARPTRSSRRATSVQRAHALLCFDYRSRRQWTRCMGRCWSIVLAAACSSAGSAVCWASQDGWAMMKPRSAAMLARAGDRLHAGWLAEALTERRLCSQGSSRSGLLACFLLDSMVVVPVGGGRGVQAYAMLCHG